MTEPHFTPANSPSDYIPLPKRERRGIALCLSGGGFRATLFHLGALRRLNELGVLTRISTFSSVSGGSILAGLLASRIAAGLHWPPSGEPIPNFDADIASMIRTFTSRNVRTPAISNRLVPWNWPRTSAGVRGLEKQYNRYLTDQLGLVELPLHPRFVFSATDIVFGVNWVFDSNYHRSGQAKGPDMGNYQAGYGPFPSDWPLARAIAASSCFPPVFNPLPIKIRPNHLSNGRYAGGDRDELVSLIRLSDGGVYDNMGLEPVWKDHAVVLVSDGGAPFNPERPGGLFWRLRRYQSIQGRQGAATRKRWLISNLEEEVIDGTYWGIGSSPQRYEAPLPGYSKALSEDVLSQVRTDLDCFSSVEAQALETHGYFLADAAINTWVKEIAPTPNPPFSLSPPTSADEQLVRQGLRHSHQRVPLGRGRVVWSARDLCDATDLDTEPAELPA